MTLSDAETLVAKYLDLTSDSTQRGARRNPNLLPAPKTKIMTAIKLVIAADYRDSSDNPNKLEQLTKAAMALDSFNDMPLGATEFIQSMQKRRDEIAAFRGHLQQITPDHRFFWQRVYPLAGAETESTSIGTLLTAIRGKLQIIRRSNP
ncbi:MAG: hypothetical protein RI897_3901 [Verrucomicrobiota bacterium]|jgi:hypothetical protein